ncbi:MAG: DUF488 domain-containing protein [Verrucomicrobia bacterium]|nr:DUF488 domain-containing protein [Verrucomicrobiota bacterium]
MIQTKRVYEPLTPEDGASYLVERLWPRGIRKTDLKIEAWCRDVAPSTELRKWFAHDAAKWPEFKSRYRAELSDRPEAWEPLLAAARSGTVTLLYSARDTEHNSALLLKEFLEERSRKARTDRAK